MMSPKRTLSILVLLTLGWAPTAMAAGRHSQSPPNAKAGAPSDLVKHYKLDDELTVRAARGDSRHKTSVIVELVAGAKMPASFTQYGRVSRLLKIVNSVVLDLPDGALNALSAHPDVLRLHYNRPVTPHNYRTSVTVGARAVQQSLGYTGAGVGVAVIDSGVATWHDDLTVGAAGGSYPYGNQRVAAFVDFVNHQSQPYDDYGHGTHVAGIIAGNGYDSTGEKAGIAPDASLVSLKVLDATGAGTIADVIAAMEWVAGNAATYHLKVVNLSVGAAVRESYWTDPLTLAAKSLVEQGIVVVAAAGNLGKNADGLEQYGGITAPGNAPWVLTVGASSTMGTLTRTDDTLAAFSSRGPTWIDFAAKPDLVAPGVGTISLAAPESLFYATHAAYLVSGSLLTPYLPYLSLSGTSMAAPVVAGTVALMYQANPSLTPNLVKAILQYTAQVYPGYNPLEEGAGFLNSLGAVRLAGFYAHGQGGDRVPTETAWSRQIFWGNHRLTGGVMVPSKNAWGLNIIWGTATDVNGQNIIWGTSCGSADCGDNIIWGTSGGDNIIWGTSGGDNIIWGTSAGDNIIWGTSGGDNIIWGTSGGDNIIWGTSAGDNIIWGTDCGPTGPDCQNVIWGTSDGDNIIWGTASAGDNIIWGTSDGDNIIWGTSDGDNIIWGTVDPSGDLVFSDSTTGTLPDLLLELGDTVAIVPGRGY